MSEPAATIEEVAANLVGLHSSDPVTVYLSAWARVDGLSTIDIDKALYDERSVLRMLGMRRTMFVVPLDLAPELKAACALLPSLDPTVMGWKERDWYLNGYHGQLFDTNGNAGPTVWWNGRVIGGWGQNPEVAWFSRCSSRYPCMLDRIEMEVQRLTGWLDGTLVKARFPTPLEKLMRT